MQTKVYPYLLTGNYTMSLDATLKIITPNITTPRNIQNANLFIAQSILVIQVTNTVLPAMQMSAPFVSL